MIDWIKTNTLDLASRRGKSVQPKSVHLMLSPYDVPNAVRTYKSDDSVIVEFRYINIKEDFKNVQLDDGVVFVVGVKTERIYKIVVSEKLLNNKNASRISQSDSIESAIDMFISGQEAKSKKTSKYGATLSAIKDYVNPLQLSINQYHSS